MMNEKTFFSFICQASQLLGTMKVLKARCDTDHSKIAQFLKSKGIDYSDFMDLSLLLQNISDSFEKGLKDQ